MEKNATVPMDMQIKHRNENFEFYAFPEYSSVHNQLEPRTLDPTHILMNLRAHACHDGFSFFNKNALIRVSDTNKKILSRPMVTQVLDQQNAEMAKRTFSKEVEQIMKDNGDLHGGKIC